MRYTGYTIAICLSVCPSVCPSVKKWLLYNNSSSVWHTMMILHIYVDLDPRRTSVDFGSKGQSWNLDFKLFLPFPHHSSIYFWHTIMILHKCIDIDLRRTSIYFGVKGSKDKAIFGFYTLYHFHMISIYFWHTIMILHKCVSYEPRRTSINFGVKRPWLTWKVWICCRRGMVSL